jgi:hypothetical protein
MSLTAEETPLAWPGTVAITDLRTCTTCAIQISSPKPGTLQILTRRAGDGHGDGVNIEEETVLLSATYRGQSYSLEEAVFHVPGLHVFPGQTAPYPAEYHIHMRTDTAPKRFITIVFPVSHLVTGVGSDYFAAATSNVDMQTFSSNPTLASLFTPGTQMIQYQGPDIRGRTAASPEPLDPTSTAERQCLLMLQPLQIRASDLERIPREGSLSTSPEDLPAPGVAPTKQVLRSRVIGYAVLATPGVPTDSDVGPVGVSTATANPVELECKPLKVIDGRDYVINTASDASSKGPLGSGRQVIGSGLQPSEPTASINPVDLVFFCLSVIIAVMIIQIIFNNFIFPTIFDVKGEVYKQSLWIHALFGIPIMIGIIVGSTYPWPQ